MKMQIMNYFDFKPENYYEIELKDKNLKKRTNEDFFDNGCQIAQILHGCNTPGMACVSSLIAYYFEDKWHYKFFQDNSDENSECKIRYSESKDPLTFRQIIENIETAIPYECFENERKTLKIILSNYKNKYSKDTDQNYDENIKKLEVKIKKLETEKYLSDSLYKNVYKTEMPNYFNHCNGDWKDEFKIVSEFYPNLESFFDERKSFWSNKVKQNEEEFFKENEKSSKNIIFRYFMEEKIKEFEENVSWASAGMFSNNIDFILGKNDLQYIIDKGESKTCEFKESLSLDVRQTQFNPNYKPKKEDYIELSVLKTICGFLNSEGGDLFIGVSDKGDVLGIKNEIEILYKKNTPKDAIQRHLKDIIKGNIGSGFNNFINAQIKSLDEKEIIHINCGKSNKEVYIKDKDFYIRSGPSTDKLEGRDLSNYIRSKFK